MRNDEAGNANEEENDDKFDDGAGDGSSAWLSRC